MGEIGTNIVSPKRVLFLSVITWGLYDFFWFLTNWKIVKQKENLAIRPFARSFLAIFYCFSFFRKTMDMAKQNGYEGKYSAKTLTLAYVALTFVGVVLGKSIPYIGIWSFVFSAIGLAAAWPLFEIQKAINFIDEKNAGVTDTSKPYTFKEKVLLVFGVLYTISMVVGIFMPSTSPFESLKQLEVNY